MTFPTTKDLVTWKMGLPTAVLEAALLATGASVREFVYAVEGKVVEVAVPEPARQLHIRACLVGVWEGESESESSCVC